MSPAVGANRRSRGEHRFAGGIGVPDPAGSRHEKEGVRQFVKQEMRGRELRDQLFVSKSKAQRLAEMTGELAKSLQIGGLEVAAPPPIAKGDNDGGGVAVEMGRGGHDGVKALRNEPVGVKLRPQKIGLRHHHPIRQGLASYGDLAPDRIAGRETLIGRCQGGVDANLTQAAKSVGSHVLEADSHAGGARPVSDFGQHPGPRVVVLCAVINGLDETLVVHRRDLLPRDMRLAGRFYSNPQSPIPL